MLSCLHIPAADTPLRLGLLPVTSDVQAGWELANVELLTRPDLEGVERERLTSVMNELRLQAAGMTPEDTFLLGRQVRADGLLRFQRVSEKGKPVWVLSLSAVTPGAILAMERLERLPPDPAILADFVVSFTERHLAKLRIPADELQGVTLLPARLDRLQMDTLDLEARMSRHFAHRLSQQPRIALLDREDLGDFLFDQFFTRDADGSFWSSAAVLSFRVAPADGNADLFQFTAEIARPGQGVQRVEGSSGPLSEWETHLDALARQVLTKLNAETEPGEDPHLQEEAARLAELAMRFYALDPDRALRFADTAWMMGNRGRDVMIIRTQTRLQDLFLSPREPKRHQLTGVPPTLMRESFFPGIEQKYGKPPPVALLAGMLGEVTAMQQDILRGVDQWSAEPRGWIALKTAMLHAVTIQWEASQHPQWESLLPSARRNAEMLRRGIVWLKENNQYRNLFLVEGIAHNIDLIWEEPDSYYAVILEGLQSEKFHANQVARLRALSPGARSRLSGQPEAEWEAARKEALDILAAREDFVSRMLMAHMQAAGEDPLFADLAPEAFERQLGLLAGEALLHRDSESGHQALSQILLLADRLNETRPGIRGRIAAGGFDLVLEELSRILPPETAPSRRDREHQRVASALSNAYWHFQEELFLTMPEGRRLNILRGMGTSRVDEVNSLLYPMVQNAREWLEISGHPLPPRHPAPAEIRLLTPVESKTASGRFVPPPGHSVDFSGDGVRRGVVMKGNGLHWAWDLRALRLYGVDPEGELPTVTVDLPAPQTPGDALYRHCLYPVRVEGDWALFHAQIPFPGRGRFYALRISGGTGYEHFIDTGEPRKFDPLLLGYTALPFGGHIRGDHYIYSPVTTAGTGPATSKPSDRIYRLNLITGERHLLSAKDEKGPLAGSENPPGTTGHLVPWGPEDSAIIRFQHNRRRKTLSLQVDLYRAAEGVWEREVIDMNELADAYADGSILNVALSDVDPRFVLLCGSAVLDLNEGGIADPYVARADRVHMDPDTLEAYVTREEETGTVRYVFENPPWDQNARALFLGDRLLIQGTEAVQTFHLNPTAVPGDETPAGLRVRAMAGDAEAAYRLTVEALDIDEIPRAFFWCRRAARAGYPGADSLMALFFLSGRLPHTQQRIHGELSPPWIKRALDQNDPWGWYALHALRTGPPQPPPHPPWDAGPEGVMFAAAKGGVVPALHYVAVNSVRNQPGRALAAMRAVDALEAERTARGEPPPPHIRLLEESTFQRRFPVRPFGQFASAEALMNRMPPDKQREAARLADKETFPTSLPFHGDTSE